jgi:hypothetical protein
LTRQPTDIATLDKIRKLFVVSEAAQLDALAAFDPEHDVVVSSDVLALETAADKGMMALPFDTGILFADLGDVIKKSGEPRLRGSDWFFDGDTDLTIFNGASLGRQFLIQCMHAICIRNHIYATLGGWLSRYAPEKIVVHGFDCAFPRPSRINQINVLESAAAALGIGIECNVHLAPASPQPKQSTGLKDVVRASYSRLLGFLCKTISLVRSMRFQKKPKALLLCTHLNALPLLERIDELPFTPVLISERFPNQRNMAWVVRCLQKGAEIVSLQTASLTPSERAALEHIRQALYDFWGSGRCTAPAELIDFARDAVVEDDGFIRAAELTKTASKILESSAADIVFTDALSNSLYNTILQQAKNRSIPVAATWHAPLLHDVLSFMLGSDPRSPALIDIMFNWGSAQNTWMKRIDATTAFHMTGTMLKPVLSGLPAVPKAGENVLVLEYAVPATDVTHRPSLSTHYFKTFCAMLNRSGYKVRFKLHPSSDHIDHYQALAKKYGLDCEIVTGEPFTVHLAWADMVIGPGHSGAMLETLMTGRPYYPVVYQPNGIWPGYFADLKVFHDTETLQAALREPYQFPRDFLEMWTSSETISDPVLETANAINVTLERLRA